MNVLKNLIKNEYFWFVTLLALGTFLRLYQLENIPPGFFGDEAWLGIDGQRVAKEGWIGVYIPSHAWGYNSLHAYIAGVIMKFFDPSILSTRLAAAIPGVFTLIVFYFLARQWYSPKVSLILLALLSVSCWHIQFSRIAFPGVILIPFFSSLAFFFVFKAFKEKRIWYFILAGLSLGLGLNSYFFYIASFLTAGIILFFRLLYDQTLIKGYLFLMVTTILVILPLIVYMINNSSSLQVKWENRSIFAPQNKVQLLEYSNDANLSSLDIIIIQLKRTIGGFFIDGDHDAPNNLPGIPLLEMPLALLLLVGIIITLVNIRKGQNYFFLLWFLLIMMMGVITESSPNSRRILDAIIPMFLLIGVALAFIEKRIPRLYFLIVFIALVLYSFSVTQKIYFQEYAQSNEVKNRLAFELVRMCEYFNTIDNPPYIYFYHPTTYFNYETRLFLCPQLMGEDRSQEFGQFSIENQREKDSSFVYFFNYKTILPMLMEKYPSGKVVELQDERGNFIVGIYTP